MDNCDIESCIDHVKRDIIVVRHIRTYNHFLESLKFKRR